MDRFLASVERRALRMAQIATGSADEALDIVQDTMLGLVQRYAGRPAEDWAPLFFQILQSRIRDWYRRGKVRSRWRALLENLWGHEDDKEDLLAQAPDPVGLTPEQELAGHDSLRALEVALRTLPLRQQQVFLLRAWEGLSVEDTATAMGCSQGSVKTHYSRAVHRLRVLLEDYWP